VCGGMGLVTVCVCGVVCVFAPINKMAHSRRCVCVCASVRLCVCASVALLFTRRLLLYCRTHTHTAPHTHTPSHPFRRYLDHPNAAVAMA
jgi:hypothetical protein